MKLLHQMILLGGTVFGKNLPKTKIIDQVFIMDCTGSMGSYIQTAKDKIVDLAEKVANKYPTYDLRLGFIGYRDIFDWADGKKQFIEIPFSTDYNQFKQELIAKVGASGGGDGPEDVYTGLEAAAQLKWDGDYRFLTLLSDAPHNVKAGRKGYADFKPILEKMAMKARDKDAPFVFTFYKIGSGTGDLEEQLKNMMPSYAEFEVHNLSVGSYYALPDSYGRGYHGRPVYAARIAGGSYARISGGSYARIAGGSYDRNETDISESDMSDLTSSSVPTSPLPTSLAPTSSVTMFKEMKIAPKYSMYSSRSRAMIKGVPRISSSRFSTRPRSRSRSMVKPETGSYMDSVYATMDKYISKKDHSEASVATTTEEETR